MLDSMCECRCGFRHPRERAQKLRTTPYLRSSINGIPELPSWGSRNSNKIFPILNQRLIRDDIIKIIPHIVSVSGRWDRTLAVPMYLPRDGGHYLSWNP